MGNTVLQEVIAIRSLLNDPLPQSPSFEDILQEMEASYQFGTNATNDTPNAWQKGEIVLTTVPGVRDYQVFSANDDIGKPLVMLTIPENVNSAPEFQLEFTQIQYMVQEYPWLGERGYLFSVSDHDSQLAGFYYKLTDLGQEFWVQLRPTPFRAQQYRILYEVSDWWSRVFATQEFGYALPYASHKHYFRALTAQNLLYKCRWSLDRQSDIPLKAEVALTLQNKINTYEPKFREWITSLVSPDVVTGEAYADTWDAYY